VTTRLTRHQLIAFVLVSVLGITYAAAEYVRLPELLGFGRYHVTVTLTEASGLYPKANVTYRGVEVGTVTGLRLAPPDVLVDLSLDADVPVPADLVAEVHSVSAVGEQYVDLVPRRDGGPVLADGDVIPVTRTTTPVNTGELLDTVRRTVDSVPADALDTTLAELSAAFAGNGDDLALLLDSGTQLLDSAEENLDPTLRLITTLVPVLRTQRRVDPLLRSSVPDLDAFTGRLAASDDDLRGVLRGGSGFARQVGGLFDDLRPTLPVLLADLVATGQVAEVYLPAVRHILVMLPASIAVHQNTVPPSRMDDEYPETAMDFRAQGNDPPGCTTGFAPPAEHRDPADLSAATVDRDLQCRVPKDDPRVVRGVRNMPCPDNPQRRAATASGCGLVFGDPYAALRERSATYNPETGRLLGPDGEFVRVAGLERGRKLPRTWQDVVTAPIRP
jgi:phospholipid/cholesterol/gamma-HCH transport system substrate-binding protein